jgi:AbrB family looped-hinge helix DNA binding protein
MEDDFSKILKVSDKGQISIPNSIRQRLGIKQGDSLVLFEINGKILLEKSQNILERVKDEFSDILKLSEQSLREVWDNKEDEIWSKYLEDEN